MAMGRPRHENPSPNALRMRASRAAAAALKPKPAPKRKAAGPPPDPSPVAMTPKAVEDIARHAAAKSNGRPARASAPPAPPRFSGPLNTTAEVLDAVRLAARGEVSLDTPTAKLLLDHLSRPGAAGRSAAEQRMIELASTCPHCGGKL